MRRTALCVALIACLAGSARGQSYYPPIPGHDVGFSPQASFALTSFRGQPAFFLVLPGDQNIASFQDPILLPPGTQRVQLDMHAMAVLEPNACAVGAEFYFETKLPLGGRSVGQVTTTGWNLLETTWRFRWSNEPMWTTWFMSYCTFPRCTSPCGPQDTDPDWEVYLLTVTIL